MYPILFESRYITIRTSGIFLVLGLLVSLWYLIILFKRKKIDINFLTDNLIWFLVSTIFFGRIFDFLLNKSDYFVYEIFVIWDGNINFFFGFLGFITTFVVISKIKQKNYWKYFDILINPFLITMFFICIGDFFSANNYGSPIEWDILPSVTYNSPDVRYAVPLHPVQLYTALYTLFCFYMVIRLQKKRRPDGILSLLVLLLYFIGDFFLDFIRDNAVYEIFGYRSSQIFDLLLVIFCIVLIIIKNHKNYLKIKSI